MELSVYDFPWNDGEVIGYVSEVLKFYAMNDSSNSTIENLLRLLSRQD